MDRHPNLDWGTVDDVLLGSTNQAGEDNRNVARMALLIAGLPDVVPGSTINRLCGSGMQAVIEASRAVSLGDAELIIAGGVESMSRAPFVVPKSESAFPTQANIASTTLGWRLVNPIMEGLGHTDALGVTAENVADDYAVNRADQDAFAFRSQQRTAAATTQGRLAEEIVPVSVPRRKGDPDLVDVDEHPRPDTTLETLAKLRPAFRAGGSVTAGNASGINDAAAALIVASEDAIETNGLEPIAKVVASTVAGVSPRIMGIGPIPATQKLLARTGLTMGDFDVVELNEAFASQSLACLRELGLPDDAEHVNPNGGAIALGHPTGMSGARITGTAALELRRRGGRRALATMCIGVGQGLSILLESV
jgi:acetyl-CoA acyltransferase